MIASRTWILPSLLLAGVASIAACSSGHDESVSSTTAQSLTVQLGRPTWATADRLVGNVGENEKIDIQVHLKMHNEQAAIDELAAISDPDSATYGQFLTDEQYDAKYAPTADDVAAVRSHLEGHGFTVTEIPGNNTYVAASGTASQARSAFGAQLGLYTVAGETRRAPIQMPTISIDLSKHVSGVLGLAPLKMTTHSVRTGGIKHAGVVAAIKAKGAKPNDTVPANTCSEWFGAIPDTSDPAFPGYGPLSYATCGFKPAQLRAAYGFADSIRKGNDGKGQIVAVVDAYLSPTLLADAQTYAANNDPDYPLAASQFSIVQGPGTVSTPDPGWYGEQTLDVEAVHAMAPGAKIVAMVAQTPSDTDLTGAINMIISKRLATIVSNSYGSAEGQANDFVIWHALATQAGLKGIGLYFSSGDSGDESGNLGFASADFPASLDNATAVGGTSLALDRNGAEVFELGWETGASFLTPPDPALLADGGVDTTVDAGPSTWDPAPPGFFVFGAGGGTSYVYEQPTWQKGIVPAALANQPGTPARVVPDVSMLADPMTGFLIGETDPTSNVYGEGAIGGTSLACPLFSATMALAQQKAGKKFGFANTVLYKASKKGAFKDIAPGATPQAVAIPGGIVTTFDFPGQTIQTAVGYDNVTGLGSPNGATFFKSVK